MTVVHRAIDVSDARRDTDGELARRAATGDQAAASRLIERYQAHVRNFLRKLTGRDDLADDLAQDTFVRMLRYADRYDPKYPMRTWLLTIARRLTINHARRRKRETLADQWDHRASNHDGPDAGVAHRDELAALRKRLGEAMQGLTDAQKQAVLLFHQQGLSVQEVAEVMEVPAGTVKRHLHRGRAAMRKNLGELTDVWNT